MIASQFRPAALRKALWRSRAYLWTRRIGERLTRPIRRGELIQIVRCDLTKPIPPTSARVPLQAFVASRAEVLEEVARLRQPPNLALRELFARRLDSGFLCFVGRADGRLVAYNWTQYEPGPDDGSYIALGPDEVHCLDAYTVVDCRGLNIHAALLREMLLFSAGLGYRFAYSKMTVTNRRSSKAHRRLCWERVGVALRARNAPALPVVRLWGKIHPWGRLHPT